MFSKRGLRLIPSVTSSVESNARIELAGDDCSGIGGMKVFEGKMSPDEAFDDLELRRRAPVWDWTIFRRGRVRPLVVGFEEARDRVGPGISRTVIEWLNDW